MIEQGWAEAYGAALADQDEQRKADATGLKPRKCIRVSWERRAASARLGGQRGAVTKRQRDAFKP
jgi:hypothetical protein